MAKVAVSIPDELFEAAEAEAARRGMTRSGFYAEALREATSAREVVDRAIVDGYRRVPQDADVDPDALPDLTDELGPYPA